MLRKIGRNYDPADLKPHIERVIAGEALMAHVAREIGIPRRTFGDQVEKYKRENVIKEQPKQKQEAKARIMFIDTELLPNRGYFYETYGDKNIPKDFIDVSKAFCAIGYKFGGDEDVTVLVAKTPYEDADILAQFLEIAKTADYYVWHNGNKFDRKMLIGRLRVNNLGTLPPKTSIDTYQMAKNAWGDALNGNGLDNLAKMLKLENQKGKMTASDWVLCAKGDKDAITKMAEYNALDVIVLEQVYRALSDLETNKINYNHFKDVPERICKKCGSSNLKFNGIKYNASSIQHIFECMDCHGWSTFAGKQ
jgi:hypothetical protein